jgi:hypothetical protein
MIENMTMFEKPKDWNVAPKSEWVSGTAIGESSSGMPGLGDPDSHFNSSKKIYFSDEGIKEEPDSSPALFRGRTVKQCPAGTSNENGVCLPNPDSEATIESKVKAATGGGKQWGLEDSRSPIERYKNSLKRELPKAKQDTSEVARLTKEGVKGRGTK